MWEEELDGLLVRILHILLGRHTAMRRVGLGLLLAEELLELGRTLRPELARAVHALVLRAGNDAHQTVRCRDAGRERAAVIQEELVSRLSEQMDKRMYVLSMVAAIFLPLGFFTGLLGINVGGIPGAEYKAGFAIFCLLLVGLVIAEIVIFKKKKWM